MPLDIGLLAEEINKRGVSEPVSKETIRVMLKNELKPNMNWCIPPKENAEFVVYYGSYSSHIFYLI